MLKTALSISSMGVCRRNFVNAASSLDTDKVVVIGAGLMGSGIAQVAAQSGYQVTIVDVSDDALNKSMKSVKSSVERIAKKFMKDDTQKATNFVQETLQNITVNTNVSDAVKPANIVIEAIVENLDVKHKLFQEIESAASNETIFATNTSSLRLKDISSVLKKKDRFGGLHFFNPVPLMKLVEVIRGPDTSDSTFEALTDFGKRLGKTTVSCKDSTGFIVNRLLVPYQMEAIRLLERGDASAKDIDIAMKLGAGYPMGPFELADFVGLDTVKFIVDVFHKSDPENPLMKPIPLLNQMVSEGKYGRKSGEGFYKYDSKK